MDKQFITLRLQRLLAGLSQHTLAEKIGRSQPWLSRAERGAPGSIVTHEDAERIGSALGVHPGKIFNETPEDPK